MPHRTRTKLQASNEISLDCLINSPGDGWREFKVDDNVELIKLLGGVLLYCCYVTSVGSAVRIIRHSNGKEVAQKSGVHM